MQAFVERLRRAGDVTPYTAGGHVILVAAAVAFLVVKFRLVASININWDEFHYLSRVHEFHRGELTSAFQTFHVQLFRWLTAVPGNEIDQMLAARYAMYALRVGTTVLVMLLGARVAGRTGGLVAAVASLCFWHVLRHGEAFRADPQIAFLFVLCATLLVWRFDHAPSVTIAALAFALAAAITIKTAIYVPALGGIVATLYWTGDADARRLRVHRALLFGAVAATAYIGFVLLHATATSAPEGEVARRAIASGAGMVGRPPREILGRALRAEWAFWMLFTVGICFAAWDVKRGTRESRARALLLLALLLPLASLLVYRNTFEYFYVAVVPLASLACGYAAASLESLLRTPLRSVVPVLLVTPLVFRGWSAAKSLRFDRIAPQREIVAAVHSIFPEPVPYLDRCGMISSFPRAPIFMSTYVLQAYRRAGVPRVAELVAEGQPGFLLANVSGLRIDRSWDTVRTYQRSLLREDFEFLQANFIPHWGPIWVPGKQLDLAEGTEMRTTMAVRGPYTVEATAPVVIDDQTIHPGDVIELGLGVHRVRGAGRVTLRYGNRLPRPREDPPFRRLFRPLDR